MNVVFLSPIGTLGGAEMCLLDLLASFRADRPDWTLKVLLGDDGPLRQAIENLGVGCAILPMPVRLARLGDANLATGVQGGSRIALAAIGPGAALAASSYFRLLRETLRAEAPDLIQTNGMKAHVLGAWAAPRGVPVVWHLHDYLSSRAVMARLLRWSARRKVRGVGVSRSVAEDVKSVLGPAFPVDPVYNAIDLSRFSPGPGNGAWLDAQSGLGPAPEGTIRIGLVATFARWKGHEVFLKAVARLSNALPARFYIVGGPLYKSAGSQHSAEGLKTLAGELGVLDRVGFAGHQEEPADVFRALDVVVHASTRPEPFGRVIVEAMACARAVVASRTGGAAELFEDGVSAIGTAPGDPDALAEALARLINDRELRNRLGAAGRREAEARFDRSRLARQWTSVYDAAGRGGPVP